MFLKHGAKINSKNKDGETLLHIMAQHRSSYDCLELLIVEGANVDAQDNDGWTPLMNAVHHPQAMIRKDVIYGLARNSDTSIKNKEGKTAYYNKFGIKGASHMGRHLFVSKLINSGVNICLVQRLANHRHISTTQRYFNCNEQMLVNAAENAKI